MLAIISRCIYDDVRSGIQIVVEEEMMVVVVTHAGRS
jgi:hypothetical protein